MNLVESRAVEGNAGEKSGVGREVIDGAIGLSGSGRSGGRGCIVCWRKCRVRRQEDGVNFGLMLGQSHR